MTALVIIISVLAFAPMVFFALTRFGLFKRASCKLGWHAPSRLWENVRRPAGDPLRILTFAKCPWCGYEGQVDSQGNLF